MLAPITKIALPSCIRFFSLSSNLHKNIQECPRHSSTHFCRSTRHFEDFPCRFTASYFALAGSTLMLFPLILAFFIAFNTAAPYSLGTSTNV